MATISDLLDDMGITDPYMRDMMTDMLRSEMSTNLSDYIGQGGRTHTKEQCKASRKAGSPKGCVLHRPTLHRLTGSPQVLRSSTLIEDLCSHGIGHPNPDSAAYLDWRDGVTHWGIHGCDGCCGPLPAKPDKYDYLEGDFPA